jgi:hypothetical protein
MQFSGFLPQKPRGRLQVRFSGDEHPQPVPGLVSRFPANADFIPETPVSAFA